uniref:Trehalase n=1 Tax=Panagrolaimus sp. JU765 TaxID=591449 RepID=A0AC34R980_9BILA
MKPAVAEKSEFYSLLPVKYEFIAPGGRFLEPYYWDAYWIIKGLMASEMYEAAARMILNYADFVERFGFIPNGGRVYYLQRSQPPLFIPMIYEFYENTQNSSFVKQLLPIMEKEFQYWIDHHSYTVTYNGNRYQLFRYFAGSNVPRPESYKEDLATASLSNFTDKQQLF